MSAYGWWRYAVRQIDEDGDAVLWTTHSSYDSAPFTSAQEARDFAEGWMDNYEVLRTWVTEPEWQPVPDEEVRGGVCLECGDAVLGSGQHIEPERHTAHLLRERLRAAIDDVTVDALVTNQHAEQLLDELMDALTREP